MFKLLSLLCFTIAVGRGASTDGKVLLAHNEDDRNVSEFHFNSTSQGLWVQVPGLKVADTFINRWGVGIVSDKCSSCEDREDLTDGGVLYEVRYSVYMFAKNARDAVSIIGRLVESRGYDSSGRSYIVADSKEAWVVSVVQGRHWVAQRVPDDEVMIIPNYYVIGKVDLSDRDNFMACPDLIQYAVGRGWYVPEKDGEFSFRRVYARPETLVSSHNTGRHGNVMAALGMTYDAENVPFSVTVPHKLGVEDLERLLAAAHVKTTIYAVVCRMARRRPEMWFCHSWLGDPVYTLKRLGEKPEKETFTLDKAG